MRRALPGIALRCLPLLLAAACIVEPPDWSPAAESHGKIPQSAFAYFGRNEPPRGVRIGDRNYVAMTGCAPANCRADRVLFLIQESGDALRALERSGDPYPRS